MRIGRVIAVLALTVSALVGSGGTAVAVSSSSSATGIVACYGRMKDMRLYSRANGHYVSAELAYGGTNYGMLRARADYPGPWEKFEFCKLATGNPNDGIYVIQSVANGKYVSAETWYGEPDYGMLRARSEEVGELEKFRVTFIGDDMMTIHSTANYLYVSTELSYGGYREDMLRARAGSPGPWEYYDWTCGDCVVIGG